MNLHDRFIESVKELEVEFRIIQDRVFDYNRESPLAIFGSMFQFFDRQEKEVLEDQLKELTKLAERVIRYLEKTNSEKPDYQKGFVFVRNLYNDEFFQSNSFGESHYGYFIRRFRSVLKKYLSMTETHIFGYAETRRDDIMSNNVEFKDSPFIIESHYKAFLYLEKHSNIDGKKKWTYIFNCLSENYNLGISENAYFSFICDNYQKVAKRTQSTATDSLIVDSLNELFECM